MGESADATLELFGLDVRHGDLEALRGVAAPLELIATDYRSWFLYAIEDLAYGGEATFCAALHERNVSYVFLHAGDHDHCATVRMFTPELGEFQRPATPEGEPLIPAVAIDHLLEHMPRDADDVWLREGLEVASGAPWRDHFARLRAERAQTHHHHDNA